MYTPMSQTSFIIFVSIALYGPFFNKLHADWIYAEMDKNFVKGYELQKVFRSLHNI